jgi:hypothetical protein
MLGRILLLVLLLAEFAAGAQTRPIRPPSGQTEEHRYVGVDFPSHGPIVQSITSTGGVYLRRNGNSGLPVCIPWETVVRVTAEQSVCLCYVGAPRELTLTGPGSAGGCQLTDVNGPDGSGACFLATSSGPVWTSPFWRIVSQRPGARLGACSVATSTTVGFGVSTRPPCRVDADCTTAVGSGTCDSLSTLPSPVEVRYGQGCAYVLARGSATGLVWVELRR